MNDDLIKRSDAIEAIHNYWEKRLETLPTKESEYGEVYADIQQLDKILEYNKALCNFIKSIPSADRPQGEWVCHEGGWIDLDYYPTKYECDQCHHYVDVASDKKFCPNCGSKMRGEHDD